MLVACARTRLRPQDIDDLEALLDDEPRWGYLIALAQYHGVVPLLYHHLKEQFEERIPPKRLDQLRQQVHMRMTHSLYLTGELNKLGVLLDEQGLEAITTKGTSLAQEIYGSVALRPYVDIDLFVRKADYGHFEAFLSDQGYDQLAMSPLQKKLYLAIHKQFTFWCNAEQAGGRLVSVLDVHTDILPPGYTYNETFDSLWERAAPLFPNRESIRSLGREDLLILLCYHGFKNRWDRLKYIVDVAEVIRVSKNLDWNQIVTRAEAMHGRRVLALGLHLAQDVLGTSLPQAASRVVEEESKVRPLTQALKMRLPAQPHMKVEPYWDRVELNINAQDSLGGRVRYGVYSAIRRVAELWMPESAD